MASRRLEKEHSLQRGGPTTLTDTWHICLLSTSSYQNVTQRQQKCLNSSLPDYPREHLAHSSQLSRKDNVEGKLREILYFVIFLPSFTSLCPHPSLPYFLPLSVRCSCIRGHRERANEGEETENNEEAHPAEEARGDGALSHVSGKLVHPANPSPTPTVMLGLSARSHPPPSAGRVRKHHSATKRMKRTFMLWLRKSSRHTLSWEDVERVVCSQ